MARNRKQLSALVWNKGADLFQVFLNNRSVMSQSQQNELLVQAIEAYVISFEIMYGGKKRLEILQEQYANDFLKALLETQTLHHQSDVEAFVTRKFIALNALKDILAKYRHNFTHLETRIDDLVKANILMCVAPNEVEGRLVPPKFYPSSEDQTLEDRMRWRQYVLARAERGAASLPETQIQVRGSCKNHEMPNLAIIDARMQLLCYQSIVEMLGTVFKTEDELALFKSQKQQAFRNYKNMTSITELIVPRPSYTPSELHVLANSHAINDPDHAIVIYKFALFSINIHAEEKRDIEVKLAGCLLKQKDFIEAIEHLKIAYLLNLELEQNTEENYNTYHARGKIILIELVRVLDLYCADLRDTNERNNYQHLKENPALKDQQLNPKNLLRAELEYKQRDPSDRYIQPTISEYSYGCRLFNTTPQQGLELRDGNFQLADYQATKSKPHVHHYVAASVIQSSFEPKHLNEIIAKLTGHGLSIPKNANKRIAELEEILKASTLQP